jgi:hypothetical protein
MMERQPTTEASMAERQPLETNQDSWLAQGARFRKSKTSPERLRITNKSKLKEKKTAL